MKSKVVPAYDRVMRSLRGIHDGTSAMLSQVSVTDWSDVRQLTQLLTVYRDSVRRMDELLVCQENEIILNTKLKTIKTKADWEEFEKELQSRCGTLVGIRRGIELFSFSILQHTEGNDSPSLHYLYNDQVATGRCKICNLHKVAIVRCQ